MLNEASPRVVQRTRELCNTFDGVFLVLLQAELKLYDVFSKHDSNAAEALGVTAAALSAHIRSLDNSTEPLVLFAREHEHIFATLQRFNTTMNELIDFAERRNWKLQRPDLSYDGNVVAQELFMLQLVAQHLTPTHFTMDRHFRAVYSAAPEAGSIGQRLLKGTSFQALATARDDYFQESSVAKLKRYIELAEAGVTFDYPWDFDCSSRPKREPEHSELADDLLNELIRDELMVSMVNDCEESSHAA